MRRRGRFSARRLTLLAMLSGVALIIFTIEAQLPNIVPIPGVKLGLANIVTLFALWRLGRREALAVLITRTLLGALVTGRVVALAYSLSGGMLSLAVCAVLMPVLKKQIWLCSMVGAVFHNIGQLAAACVIVKSAAVFAYFPILAVSGVVTGLFTGLGTHFLMPRLERPLDAFLNRNGDS